MANKTTQIDESVQDNTDNKNLSGPTLTTETTLSINNLTKIYTGSEQVKAVDDVSFNIKNEEFVSIIGPSGSGKSTILRMIAGFEEVTDGEIILDREVINSRPPFSRETNMMFQDLALFPNMSVEENIAYGLKQDGIEEKERLSQANEMLDMVQMSGYGNRSIDQLSGGEQQRVALARCIVNRPKLVLFDEPLASLDRKLRREMTKELRRIKSETGLTFLYVTHDQEVALSVSDRVIVLNEGKIEQRGSPSDLYENPESKFVADFVGDMNIFDLRNNGQEIIPMEKPNLTNKITLSTDVLPSGKQRVTVGLRPHDVDIIETSDHHSDCYIQGEITGKVFNKNKDSFTVETCVGEIIATSTSTASVGDTVNVCFTEQDMHVLEADENE